MRKLGASIHVLTKVATTEFLKVNWLESFTTLKKRLEVADGALGLHLGKLEEIGYLTCKKAFIGRRPKSTYTITTKGKRALSTYLDAMQQLINALEKSQRERPVSRY